MAAKVQETENKKASKARNREGERGQWWPCETTDTELRELQNEGMISAHWSFIRDTVVPKPGAGEVVMTKAWVERGLSLPCSEFFLSVLNTYGLQPHNICPNSYLLLSNFATLCEGHLGIRPDVKLWQFFFRVKKETKDKAMLNCGSMTFMLRPGRMYPPHDSHESVRYWNAGWFYEKNVSVPEIHDGLPKFNNEPPEELASWSFIPSLSLTPILEKAARRISWLVHDGLTGTQLTLSWFTRRIQPLRYNARLICAYTGADDQLRATRHDLPADSLKRRFKTLVKIGRGQPIPELIKDIYTNDQCPPLATLAEENLRTILRVPVSGDTEEEVPDDEEEEEEQAPRKAAPRPSKRPRAKAPSSEAGTSGEASAKKPKIIKPPPLDSRKAEREQPLGYSERRRNKFPRDDVLSLAGDDCKDLISASRKICHNLSLKKSRTCLQAVKRMDILRVGSASFISPSAAAMTLTMCLAHNPEMDLDRVTTGVPPTADVGALLDAVSGYDTRIARRIRHDEFYDKAVLPADEPLEAELQKERDAEARPAESGTQFTWTSSKDAPQEEPKSLRLPKKKKRARKMYRLRLRTPKGKIREGNASPSKAGENFYVLRDKTMHHFGPSEGL
ncbi:hypothetical protein QYE76_023128 [Lolium multiflorum]|uniref:Transposase (putative) gypsy type domain-containing protein n=1 Tax=Lolium multiflorum TaxID=4521 RepID=A0AAD8RB46_LOLMU|nr:hypothetical protein QYE76_023128 [Lolium multiflorum]